ncbi:MAG: YtxH domain-containing protein [Coriobacteriales bacterium]|nr:YtxH domain-containing protein [Actinomycetes bacterium]
MSDNRSGEGILGAFILGGVVGAVLGLLFAPRSGRESRELIAVKAKDYWGEGREFYETGREKVTEVYSTGRDKATETAEELKVKLDAARARLREQVDSVSNEAKSKVTEYAPVAKEKVQQAAETVITGVANAESKAAELLDKVTEKTGQPGEAVKPSEGSAGTPAVE